MLSFLRILLASIAERLRNGPGRVLRDWLMEPRYKTPRRVAIALGLAALVALCLLIWLAGGHEPAPAPTAKAPQAVPGFTIGPGLTAVILIVSLIAIWLAKYYYMDEEKLHWAVAIAIVAAGLCAIVGTLTFNILKACRS